MTLSRGMLEVLEKLAKDGPCPTSTSTTGVYVNGVTVAALKRRGLAKYVRTDLGLFWAAITDEGRGALEAGRR